MVCKMHVPRLTPALHEGGGWGGGGVKLAKKKTKRKTQRKRNRKTKREKEEDDIIHFHLLFCRSVKSKKAKKNGGMHFAHCSTSLCNHMHAIAHACAITQQYAWAHADTADPATMWGTLPQFTLPSLLVRQRDTSRCRRSRPTASSRLTIWSCSSISTSDSHLLLLSY